MKKLLLVLIFIFAGLKISAQTDGISYQAVIIDPNGIELPGVDSDGNILPNAKISIRFTILDATNSEEYHEVLTTETDLFGRINLIIGNQNPDTFALIDWDGTPKDLKVEIDFKGTGSNFVDMSREKLTFVPFSYHRNILARGTLIVDDTTDLNGELIVQGPTNLNSTLNVNDNNDTNLSGQLNVEGKTNLKSNFNVDGVTTFNDSISVNAKSNFTGNMQVTADAVFEGKMEFKSEEPANFNSMVVKDSINVEGPSNLIGRVRIDASSNVSSKSTDFNNKSSTIASQNVFNDYPLTVKGSQQGIAIRINGTRSEDNNFISFWDQTLDDKGTVSADGGRMWGRIEGISNTELENSDEYIQERKGKNWDIFFSYYDFSKTGSDWFIATLDLIASSTSSTACVGVGACVTTPIPSLIFFAVGSLIFKTADLVFAGVNLGKAIKERVNFHDNAVANIGVTYASGAGDYAEWLPKENVSDSFFEGEIVGIKNGKVSKNVWGVEKIMIVSTNPIVLGNMPQPNNEKNSVKIAFMGQVPVKVLGKVKPGDYILPHELVEGVGKAVPPNEMKTNDYKKVAGVVWNLYNEITDGLNIVNVAVGINTNDLSDALLKQEAELKALQTVVDQLKIQMQKSNSVLADLVPGYAEASGITKNGTVQQTAENKQEIGHKKIEDQIVFTEENDIVYFEISKKQIKNAIEIAREQYQEMFDSQNQLKKIALGENLKSKYKLTDITLIPIEDHPFWQRIDSNPAYKDEIVQYIQSGLEKAFHTHKKYAHKFTDLKVKE